MHVLHGRVEKAFHSCACINIYTQKSTFLIQIQVPQSTAKLAQLSPMKARKRSALDVLYSTLLPRVPSLFVMSLICLVRNGSTHGHEFKKQQVFIKHDQKSSEKRWNFFSSAIPPFVSPLTHLCLEIFNPFMPRDFWGMLNT